MKYHLSEEFRFERNSASLQNCNSVGTNVPLDGEARVTDILESWLKSTVPLHLLISIA